MRGKYTQVPADAFSHLGFNAGIMVKNFDPATGEVSGLMGATTGGLSFEATPEFQDFGDDVDNLPKNTKEMKQINDITVHVSGTLLTLTAQTAKSLMAAADIDPTDTTKIIPRMNLTDADFDDIWIVTDYSDTNQGVDAGFVAIHLMNVLNTGGFRITTADRAKTQWPFDYTAHYTMVDPDEVPYEVYVKGGAAEAPSIVLNKHTITLAVDEKFTLKADVVPEGSTVTWATASGTIATVSAGEVTGKEAGSTIITASITADGVTYSDTCTVIVEAAEG